MKIEDSLDVGVAIADCRSNSRPRGRISLRRMGGKELHLQLNLIANHKFDLLLLSLLQIEVEIMKPKNSYYTTYQHINRNNV